MTPSSSRSVPPPGDFFPSVFPSSEREAGEDFSGRGVGKRTGGDGD